jgi:hypothetical protein
MRIREGEYETMLTLETTNNCKTCAHWRPCVCVYAQSWSQITLLIIRKFVKQLILSNLTSDSIKFVCGYIVEQGVTTFRISGAFCQTAEHPVWCHLNQSCRSCVIFLSVLMKGDLNTNGFRKVWIWPFVGNLWWQLYLHVSSKFRDVNLSQYDDPIIRYQR